MSKITTICICFGLFAMFSAVAVNGHMNLFLNQHEVMRLLGKLMPQINIVSLER